jgi:hypothetical protein
LFFGELFTPESKAREARKLKAKEIIKAIKADKLELLG